MIKQTFHNGWKFKVDNGSAFDSLMRASQQEREVQLPHDASIETERSADDVSGSGNGFFAEQNYVYTKEFVPEESDGDKNVWLEFEGVYQNAFVYINGSFAGKCAYGYGNFYIDATKFINFGKKNLLKVVVKNGVPSGRWYTGGGIYRNVNLMIADRMHIVPDGVQIAAEDIEEGLAKIRADVEIEYTGTGTRDIYLVTELLDAQGKTVAEERTAMTVFEGTKASYRQNLYVKNPNLWDAEHPYLYRYHSRLEDREDGTLADEEKGIFGIRKMQLDPVHGLRINGREVKLRGGCIHHDNGVIGTAEFPHAEEFRVQELKKAGFNAIRSSHYPMSRTLLQACDKYGMYVMDEFSDVWTSTKVAFDYGAHMSEWWEHDVSNLVRKDYNHPSVIMYSIGNEIPENGNKIDVQWGKKLADKIRSLDPFRYVTNSTNLLLAMMDKLGEMMAAAGAGTQENAPEMTGEINSTMTSLGEMMAQLNGSDFTAGTMEEASSQVDITGYNYAAVRYEKDLALYPNRILVGSETYPRDLDVNWELVEKYPHVIGDFDWTAWDYLGEAGIGKISYGDKDAGYGFYASYPCKAAYCGDLNLIGDRRPVSYWREIIWGLRRAPYLCVQPPEHYGQKKLMTDWSLTDALRSWNFSGYENKPVVVEIYTDADEAELFVNGKSVERKTVGTEKKYIAMFDTVYVPGTLEAVVYKDGKEYGRDRIVSASSNVHLQAQADLTVIPADGSDITYIDLSVVDEFGIFNPGDVQKVSVELEGPGVILGYGSADPESEENYFDRTVKTYEGRLRAAVRATGAGEISVTFKGEDCGECTVKVAAE